MTRTLRIGEGLVLPVDLITQTTGIFARKGAGKTYTASVIVEEVIKARLPVVVIDPLGAWWGLRSTADGNGAGLPVIILGGEHGDVPLESTAGATIADVVIEHPGAYIIDLSDFTSDAEQDRFVTAFLQRLYRGKARNRDPLLLVLDEADMFAPQVGMKGQEHLLSASKTIARRARLRGIGSLWITQRPAVLHADVRAMIELLIVLQVTGRHDRDALEAWLKGKTNDEERLTVVNSLASLAVGELWASSPSWLRLLVKTKARPRETFDSSKTPEVGEKRIDPKAFAKVDVDALGERIVATREQAKANDPVALRRRIAELERDSARKNIPPIIPEPEVRIERVEVPVPFVPPGIRQSIRTFEESFTTSLAQLREVVDRAEAGASLPKVGSNGSSDPNGRGRAERAPRGVPVRPDRDRGVTAVATLAPAAPSRAPAPATDGVVRLGRAERTFLAALAQHRSGLTQSQLSLITGYSAKSGHFANVLGKLRAAALIEPGWPSRITDTGLGEVGDIEPLPAPGPELVEFWMGRIGKAERAMLEVFIAEYPDSTNRDFLSERSGYSAQSGHFANVLGRLRTLGLVDGWRASPELMGGM